MDQSYTRYGGVVLAGVGLLDHVSRSSSCLLIGYVVSRDVCGRRLPGEGDGVGGQGCELDVGGSLDDWFT